jgi:hypothetical protein
LSGTLVTTNDTGEQVGPYEPLSGVQSAPALAIYFQDGAAPITVDSGWSPDGTRLVFDLGAQGVSGGFPTKSANPATLQLYTVGVNGTGLAKLHDAAAGYPV